MLKNFEQKYSTLWMLVLLFHQTYAVINRTVATTLVGDSPVNIAITPDNRFGYVANNNDDGIPGGDTVSVIDLKTNKVIKTISDPSFNQVYTVTINEQGSKAYITNSNSNSISIIDIATNTVVGVITGFDGPSGMAIMPNGRIAYVNNYGGSDGVGSGNGTTVRVVDLETNTIIGPAIVVGLAPAALAITPDGAFVYVINYTTGNPHTGQIAVIDTKNNTVIQTIHGLFGPYAIVITSDGNYAYISNFGSNNFSPIGKTVSVLDLKTNKIITNIDIGTQPAGIALSPNGAVIYVAIFNTLYLGANFTNLTAGIGIVRVINTKNNQLLSQKILVGSSPAGITISPNGKRAYVCNYGSNNVTVLDIDDSMWLF